MKMKMNKTSPILRNVNKIMFYIAILSIFFSIILLLKGHSVQIFEHDKGVSTFKDCPKTGDVLVDCHIPDSSTYFNMRSKSPLNNMPHAEAELNEWERWSKRHQR